jgi:hypothetical protein
MRRFEASSTSALVDVEGYPEHHATADKAPPENS